MIVCVTHMVWWLQHYFWVRGFFVWARINLVNLSWVSQETAAIISCDKHVNKVEHVKLSCVMQEVVCMVKVRSEFTFT